MSPIEQRACSSCPSQAVVTTPIAGDQERREWTFCPSCGHVDSPVRCTVEGCTGGAVALCDGAGCEAAVCGRHRAWHGRMPLQRCKPCARKRHAVARRRAEHRQAEASGETGGQPWWAR